MPINLNTFLSKIGCAVPMTRLEVLEQELYENNIKLIQDNLENFDAVTLKIDNTIIVLDNSRYKTEQEKYIILSKPFFSIDTFFNACYFFYIT